MKFQRALFSKIKKTKDIADTTALFGGYISGCEHTAHSTTVKEKPEKTEPYQQTQQKDPR